MSAAAVLGGALGWWLRQPAADPGTQGYLGCEGVQALADAYFRGELSADVRTRVRDHLAICPKCAAWFRQRQPAG
jgi:hypothetical protein